MKCRVEFILNAASRCMRLLKKKFKIKMNFTHVILSNTNTFNIYYNYLYTVVFFLQLHNSCTNIIRNVSRFSYQAAVTQ